MQLTYTGEDFEYHFGRPLTLSRCKWKVKETNKRFIWHFILTDRLRKYATLNGIRESLNIMVEYHHIDISVDKAIRYLEEHDEELFAVFQPFFIELQRFCAEYQHNYKSQF